MAKQESKKIMNAVLVIIFGLALQPTIADFVDDINYSLSLGGNSYNLSFLGFFINLLYLAGVGFLVYKIWDV